MKYYKTKSKTFAYAVQYVTNEKFYKFTDLDNNTIYSFIKTDELMNKIEKINIIKFNIE